MQEIKQIEDDEYWYQVQTQQNAESDKLLYKIATRLNNKVKIIWVPQG